MTVLLMVALVLMSPANAFSEDVEPAPSPPEDITIVITAFNTNPDILTILVEAGTAQSDIPLPATLQATADGGETDAYSVAVATWVCEGGYDAYAPGLYTFEPVLNLDENVVLADGVVPPAVDVIVAEGEIEIEAEGIIEAAEFDSISLMSANSAATIHMNGGTGYIFNFVFLQASGAQQTITVPGNGSVAAVYPNGNLLAATDQLLYVLVTDSNGNPVGTILQNAIGHKSDAGAVLQADGSMGPNGTMVGNTGTINFWFNGFIAPPTTPPTTPPANPTSYIMGHKVWINYDGSPDPNPPTPFNFILNGAPLGGTPISNISVLPDVPILVKDGTYTLSEPSIEGYQLSSIVSSTMQPNLSAGTASATTNSGNYSATFTNQVEPAIAKFPISGLKIGNGAPVSAGQFNFAVVDNATENVVATATNDAQEYYDDGTSTAYAPINFPSIVYTAADVGIHTYTVYEVGTNSTAWTYDSTTQWTVVVSVTLNPDGTQVLANSTMYPMIEFHNYYNAVASYQPQATKSVSAGANLSDGQFNFAITDNSTGLVVSTGTNDATGNINFAPLTYNSMQTGVHTYTVSETSKNSAGWIVDPRTYTLSVNVVPDPSSPTGYTITSTYMNSSGTPIPSINFSNVYNPRAFFSLSANKQTNGPALTAGQFQFAVYDDNGNVVATGTNNASGTITFTYINYYLADVGYHSYTIRETSPSGGGWTVSSVQYPVLVHVGDNGNGTMTVNSFNLNTADFVFVNTYGSTGSVTLNANKTVKNGTLTAGQFSFAVQDENGVTVATATNDAAGNIVFPPINYTNADVGTHNYTMFETSPGGNGWSTSPAVYNVSVTVTDNGSGTLVTAISYPGGAVPSFINTYNSAGSAYLDASKVATGNTLKAGQFSFAVLDSNGAIVSTATNDANGDIIFPAILYSMNDLAGSPYSYTIIETSTGGQGWATDTTQIPVTVSLQDIGGGVILATPSYGLDPTFTNTYTATGSVTLNATKTAMPAGASLPTFNFAILDSSGATVATGANDASGNIAFTSIPYNSNSPTNGIGLHRYIMIETTTGVNPGESGWVTSTARIPVWVNVTDNGDGTLTATPTYPLGTAVFTNTLDVLGSVELTATKQAIGGDLSGVQFDFAVLDDSNGVTVATGTNDAAGDIVFSLIHYTDADIGQTYDYTMIETSVGGNGWTTDSTVGTDSAGNMISNVSVAVTFVDGQLVATPTYSPPEPEGIVFINTYASSGSVSLTATKTAVGNILPAGMFRFAVQDENGETIANGTNDAAGDIVFEPIEYTSADLADSPYSYTIVETSTDGNGWTTDKSSFTVEVELEDNGDGTITATPTYPLGGVVFTNTYSAAGSVTLTATKTAVGNTLSDAQFGFVVQENGVNVATGINDEYGNITFSPINYQIAYINNGVVSDVGIHNYTIIETNTSGGGWTTDPTVFNISVRVTDNGDGTMTATPIYPSGGVVFTNTYRAVGSVTLNATKNINGGTLSAGQFSFAVLDENGATVATGINAAPVTPGTTQAGITFTPISYTNNDVGTHNYTVIETSTGGPGWTTSSSQIPVSVSVTDNNNGILAVATTYPSGGVVFTNTYQAVGDVYLIATKNIVGGTLSAGQFSFAVLDSNNVTVATGTNDAAGAIAFSPIHYIDADVGLTHDYTIIETSTDGNGWTTSAGQTPVPVTVTVTDNYNGTLTITPSYPTGGVVFTNTYAATGSISLIATKTVVGNSLPSTGAGTGSSTFASPFSFVVLENGDQVATASNNSVGHIIFTPITYTYNEVGLHYYTIRETSLTAGGWTSDPMPYYVTVNVTDNGDGTLTATPIYPAGGVVFTNTYVATGSLTGLTATKLAVGGESLTAGQFAFAVLDQSGNAVATGTNDAAGIITFTPIPYISTSTTNGIGLHRYVVVETGPFVPAEAPGWTTSSVQIPLWVTVTDNNNGILTATPVYPFGAAVFTNIYGAAGDIVLSATKAAVGAPLTDAPLPGAPPTPGQFSFAVLDSSKEIVATGTNDAAGIITFSPIHYTQDDFISGMTHSYTIIETTPSVLAGVAGWTTDNASIPITVSVVDAGGGEITATQDPPAEEIVFVNTFYPAMNFSVTKTVDKPAVFVGETSTWSVVAAIPYGIAISNAYAVADALDPALQYIPDTLTVTGLSSPTATTGPIIPADANYTVDAPSVANLNTLTVNFTAPDGLRTLSNYEYVLIRFSTISNANIAGYYDRTLDNSATVTFRNNRNQLQSIVPANLPTEHTAAILINKLDATTRTGENVNGAVFKIASSAENASAGRFLRIALNRSILDVGDPGYDAAVDWVATTARGTTAAGATALFAGVKDFTQNAAGARSYSSYWLVETTAPFGYNLPGNSIQVNFTANNSTPANSYTVSITALNGDLPPGYDDENGYGYGNNGNGGNSSTGDDSNMLLWSLLMTASALGLACILLWRVRQRISKE